MRPEIGITAYLHSEPRESISCIFKHLGSDFIVQELLDDETICEIGQTTAPTVNTKEEKPATSEDLEALETPSKIDEETRRQILEYRLKDGGNVSVDVKACFLHSSSSLTLCFEQDWSKDERRELHTFVRLLGGLDSTTKDDKVLIHKLSAKGYAHQLLHLDSL